MSARIVSVNVGRSRLIERRGRAVPTSIWKTPVAGRVAVRGVNVEGDEQSDKRVHGGPAQAVYAYASEDIAWWSERLGRPLEPGSFGENLTLEGVDVSGARVGERWRTGTALLEVTAPRLPCFKLEARLAIPGFIATFIEGGRPGAYLRIVEEGTVAAGDAVRGIAAPAGAPTMAQVMAARTQKAEAAAG